MKANSKSKISRRSLLKSGVAATTAAAAGTLGAPMIWAQSNIVLRQSGTGVSAFNEIAAKAKEELGINIEYMTVTSDEEVKKAVTQPDLGTFTGLMKFISMFTKPTTQSKKHNTPKIALIYATGPIMPNHPQIPFGIGEGIKLNAEEVDRNIGGLDVCVFVCVYVCVWFSVCLCVDGKLPFTIESSRSYKLLASEQGIIRYRRFDPRR